LIRAQQEAYGRRECIGKMPVTGRAVLNERNRVGQVRKKVAGVKN